MVESVLLSLLLLLLLLLYGGVKRKRNIEKMILDLCCYQIVSSACKIMHRKQIDYIIIIKISFVVVDDDECCCDEKMRYSGTCLYVDTLNAFSIFHV
jgi:hypothetical protein